VVYDAATGQTWRVNAATECLVSHLASGWRPGTPPPPALAAHVPGARPPELQAVVERLAREDLVRRPEQAERVRDRGAPRWADLRLPVASFPPPPFRRALVWTAFAAPVAAALLMCWVAAQVFSGNHHWVIAVWRDATAGWEGWQKLLVQLASPLLLAAVHECGHALALAAAGGNRVTVGLRLFWGLPQAYTDASRLVTLPRRSHRLAVLFGGLALEMLVWAALALWVGARAGAVPVLVLAMVLFGGPLSVLRNLFPFYKSDGYYVLQELSGIDNLGRKGRVAALSLLEPVPGAQDTAGPWWLPFYGLIHLHLIALVLGLVGIGVGAAAGLPSLGAWVGFGGAAGYLWMSYRTLAKLPARGNSSRAPSNV
jgi:hypothetical protein